MNKIFGIGLTRTATTSLEDALNLLGIPTVHWISEEMFEHALSRYTAVLDMPVTTRYKALDRRFPGSKFVHTVRDLEGWLDSCRRWFGSHPPDELKERYRVELYGIRHFDPEVFRKVYHRHHSEIAAHFKGRPEDLLTLDICKGEGWEKLVPFIGSENISRPLRPGAPFPHSNSNDA